MGQQQLLLIILGTIIVGIAIAVGITLFRAAATNAARDAVALDLEDLAARAQAYYRKPRSLGGGERTFTMPDGSVITINNLTAVPSNNNGVYVVDSTASSAQRLVLIGQGYEVVGDLPVEIKVTVTPDSVGMETVR